MIIIIREMNHTSNYHEQLKYIAVDQKIMK